MFISRTGEHSKENIPRSKQEDVGKHFFTRVAKYLKDDKHNSFNFARTVRTYFRAKQRLLIVFDFAVIYVLCVDNDE